MQLDTAMQIWTDLFGSYEAGNDFKRVKTGLCDSKCFYAAGNNFMQAGTNLRNRIGPDGA